ncbi:MAG TPA: sensor histidine kinase [Candidatus Dormibacteraeota bacterium]
MTREYHQGLTTAYRARRKLRPMLDRGLRFWRRSDWLGLIGTTAVVTLVAVGVIVAAPGEPGRRQTDALGIAAILVASLSVAATRRFPRLAFAVSLAGVGLYQGLGYSIQSPYFLPLFFTGYAAGLRGGRLQALGFAAAEIVVFLIAGVASRDPGGGLFISVPVAVALLTGVVARELRAADAVHRDAERRRQAELMLAEERLRIARELHDVVSHSIAMIGVQAGVAAHLLDREPEQARAALAAIKEASRDALQDLRGILGVLRETDGAEPRAPAAGLAQLPDLLAGLRRAGLEVAVAEAGAPRPLPSAVDLAAYRIVQEALTNVLRHAPGATARVSLRYAPERLEIEVSNDGIHGRGQPMPGAGLGLAGLRERAAAAGGELTWAGPVDDGFAVRAWVPAPAP